MIVVMLRHFKTYGNTLGRYIGTTDEEILPIQSFISDYPVVEHIYVSPMKRCLKTAEYIYPKTDRTIVKEFRECDFGRFENKNYQELCGDEQYQQWIDSNGQMPFPEGEDPAEFRHRSIEAFARCVQEAMETSWNQIALVVHGGTIMSIMEAFSSDHKSYYDYQVANGCGYVVELKEEVWNSGKQVVERVMDICAENERGLGK